VAVKGLDKEKKETEANANSKFKKEEERLKEAEAVAESGRLFLRNLSYTVMESDLKPLFEKFGMLSLSAMKII